MHNQHSIQTTKSTMSAPQLCSQSWSFIGADFMGELTSD
jgi:hypothetical protein